MSNAEPAPRLREGLSLRHTLRAHTERITRIAWSADGRRLASPSVDETIRVWDVNTGRPAQKFRGHEDIVTGVAWSPDGRQIATSSDDCTVRLWDVDSERRLPPILTHPMIVTGVAWSPDGRQIATSCDDEVVRLWDAATGAAPQELKGHTNRALCVAWSPDGKTLASASWDGTVRLWDAGTGRPRLPPLNHRNKKKVFHVAWSGDGRMLASAGFDSPIYIWDAETGRRLDLLEGHRAGVLSVSFSFDGRHLASKSEDGTIRLWRVGSWESVELDMLGVWPYSSLAFSPNEPVLAALGEFDRVVYVMDVDFDALFPARRARVPSCEAAGPLHILHLSDIHLGTKQKATQYFVQLKNDLNRRLGVERLQHLVISGDITDHSAPEQYDAALQLVSAIAKDFRLSSHRIILAPGNHDLCWEAAEQAYRFRFRRQLPRLPGDGDEKFIPAGEVGWLERDDALYLKRFERFAAFHEQVCRKPYPLAYDEQGLLHLFKEAHILFLTLNSSWNLDSYYTSRACINPEALSKALLGLGNKYEGWLKIAVWHHPVSGRETMDDTFLEQLASHGFQLVLHGHVHRAVKQIYEFDSRYGMRVIGAGTFGAPAAQQAPGIPLQYNLLSLDAEERTCTVHIGKKENPDGAWTAYGSYPIRLERWGG